MRIARPIGVSVVHDAGIEDVYFRAYSDHLAPTVVHDGVEYDLTAGKRALQKGVRYSAGEHIERYARHHGLTVFGMSYPLTEDEGMPREKRVSLIPRTNDSFGGSVPYYSERGFAPFQPGKSVVGPSASKASGQQQMSELSGEAETHDSGLGEGPRAKLIRRSQAEEWYHISHADVNPIPVWEEEEATDISDENGRVLLKLNLENIENIHVSLQRPRQAEQLEEISGNIDRIQKRIENLDSDRVAEKILNLGYLAGLYRIAEHEAGLRDKPRLARRTAELKAGVIRQADNILKGVNDSEEGRGRFFQGLEEAITGESGLEPHMHLSNLSFLGASAHDVFFDSMEELSDSMRDASKNTRLAYSIGLTRFVINPGTSLKTRQYIDELPAERQLEMRNMILELRGGGMTIVPGPNGRSALARLRGKNVDGRAFQWYLSRPTAEEEHIEEDREQRHAVHQTTGNQIDIDG